MARAPTPIEGEARVLRAAGGAFPVGERVVLRRRGQSRENRHSLPLLRVVRPREYPDAEIYFRGVGGGRSRNRAGDATLSGGETFARALSPPSAAGFLGGGVERP